MISVAEHYYHETGGHLPLYGDIGELFGAITYGIKLHRQYAKGSDGRLDDDFIEVKTISPFKTNDYVEVAAKGHFSQLLVVKINHKFEIACRLIPRKYLPKEKRGKHRVN